MPAEVIDYDNLPAEIDRLHAEAEDCGDAAKMCDDPDTAAAFRRDATRKIRLAARLRAQIAEAI